jgi:uncharacterized Zn-binding protein involved in type VI secretion
MATKVGANGRTVVHKDSKGTVSFMPDVCLTPAPPGPPVPIPYPNVALSQDADQGAKTVLVDGNPVLVEGSVFSKSSGDEAGCVGGVTSGVTKGAAQFIGGSFDVFVEGKGVARMGDLMLGNKGGTVNTPPVPEQQAALGAQAKVPAKLAPDSMVVVVTDDAGKPLAGVRYLLRTPQGDELEGKTDASGRITVQETVWGLGRIVFPDLEPRNHVESDE